MITIGLIAKILKKIYKSLIYFYIYRKRIAGQDTRFKDLQAFSQKSDVYISKYIKTSVQNGSIDVIDSDKDKRQKLYMLTEKAKETIRSFGFKATYSDDQNWGDN